MKTRSALCTLLFFVLPFAGLATGAESTPAAAAALPELTIVVVDSLSHGAAEASTFDRIDRVFTEVFEKQKWPVKIAVKRFGAGAPDYPVELRVFYEGIKQDVPGELTFRAWVTLTDHGKKHDFGIIKYQMYPRPGENVSDSLDKAVRGAAQMVVSKIEPLLFPKTPAQKS